MFLIFALPVFAFALAGLLSWGPAVLMIGGLIFVHELGHFLVAKRMGMPVEIFSMGFGPRLLGFKWRETDVRLSALPLGGYVKLHGFNPEDPEAEDPHGFLTQPAWKRQLFYAGGVLFNVLTALVLLTVVETDAARVTGGHPLPSPLQVLDVVPGSPADKGGVRRGDQIQALGELRFPGASDKEAVAYIQAHPGQPIPVVVTREDRIQTLALVPEEVGGKGKLGIQLASSQFAFDRRPMRLSDLGTGALGAVKVTFAMGRQVLEGFVKLFTFRANVKELGGPIAIARMGNAAAKAGWMVYLQMTALISMNLAIPNLLPIPFLDGGHMALLAFEKARGKDLSVVAKERILTGGFFLLASLMMLVLAMDVWKLRH